jgi:DNA replication protein DnaC
MEPLTYNVEGVTHYGRRQTCPCQEEAQRRKEQETQRLAVIKNQARYIYSWIGGDSALSGKTFENFDASKQPEAYEASRMYARNPNGTLVLYGTFGTGKTHLLAAVCNEAIIKYGTRSLFTTAPELFAAIQQRIASNADYYSLVEQAARTPLFVIDDIDKSKWTEFREEIYFAIIDKRTKRELPTAISTNRLDDLGGFVGGAVCSRLQVGQIAIPMNGADYRKGL